jgi:phospholipase C
VLGPTHPNRLMQMTGTIDPGASAGGPILVTNSDQSGKKGTCSWQTMPEVLQSNNISWKCYNPHGSNYQPGASFFVSKNMLLYFKQYLADPSSSLYKNAFEFYGPAVSGGLTDGTSPNDFASDVMNNTLPQVSWILSPDSYDEHPPAPAALGEWYTQQILDTLLSNPAVWASTVLFIMHDENDGFFDHVPPPTPPSGTTDEYLASPLPSDAGGIDGPVGMGVRVPMIVVSPFSAGGYVCHDTFDHTSQLKFLETLFNVSAPNISNWRRSVTGDLTASLPVLDAAVTKAPRLPATSSSTTAPPVGGECSPAQILELNPATPPLPFWKHHQMPKQSTRTLKPTPS